MAGNELNLARWCQIAKWRPPARARKNFWRLWARYPEIMQRLGLSELSVYQ